MNVTIDPHSGFCFGVTNAVEIAERELAARGSLLCLGDIVHNEIEVERLKHLGLKIITHEEFKNLHDCKVLIRAHGEPPETYRTAYLNNIELIDATCPVVNKLQKSVNEAYTEMKEKDGQIVIFGKEGHAEVSGLSGHADNTAIVISEETGIGAIDFIRPVRFFSQTTKSISGFHKMVDAIQERMTEASADDPADFKYKDSICRQVSNRAGQLRIFAAGFDVVIFVSGKQSSNGLVLYDVCREVNRNTYLVSGPDEIRSEWFLNAGSAGVCGATSTPVWLMEAAAREIEQLTS